MIEWATPSNFLLLLLIPALLFYVFSFRKKRTPTLLFSQTQRLKGLSRGWRAKLAFLPTVLFVVSAALMAFALARPRGVDAKVKRNVEGIDIVVALDISESMLIEDMKPDRLEAAKETIRNFVQGRVSDRIGFVAFAGEAYTRVPLTLDYKMLTENLMAIQSTRTIKMGTAIGVALASAASRLKDSTAKSRVVVLLTDGENNSGTIAPETALEIAKGYSLKVYTIGIGRDGQAQIPVPYTDGQGRVRKRYYPIHSKVNDDLLGHLAKETGGKYYRAIETDALAAVFKDIDRLEKTKIEESGFVKYNEMFQSYLFWALVVLGFGLILQQTVLRRSE